MKHRPLVLIVLDGWGHREAREHNAILSDAATFHALTERYPSTLLSCSGEEVGLPLGLMGNSEVGHMNLGAGRVVWQDITRIDRSIREGTFFENGAFCRLIDRVRRDGKVLHLLGLVSDGGVHSSDHHLRNLLKLAAQRGMAPDKVAVHAILDGRDTPPRSGAGYVEALEKPTSPTAGVGRIASVVGRYWAMDRDKRWERVAARLRPVRVGRGGGVGPHGRERARRRARVLRRGRRRRVRRAASSVGDPGALRIQSGRRRALLQLPRGPHAAAGRRARSAEDFDGFERRVVRDLELVTMTQYRDDFPFPIAYPPVALHGLFSEVVSAAGLQPGAHRRDREVRPRDVLLLRRRRGAGARRDAHAGARVPRWPPTTSSRR